MMWIMGISYAQRLHYIDLLREILIEKGIVDIKLENSPLAIKCNAKHNMDDDEIYHGIGSLVKINA